MPRVRVFHWKTEEAQPLLKLLRDAGYTVEHFDHIRSTREIRENPPDAVVVDLSRMPSHGREIGVYLRGSKATRHIPIVFVGAACFPTLCSRS
jgi:response regulator RpfG family c-di-GMP phosphodiesterase